ncbi:MAG: PhoH family protein [Geminicoccaceae bacterium]
MSSASVLNRHLTFPDNRLCMALFGQHHENLARIEQQLQVHALARGNEVVLEGDDAAPAEAVLRDLYARVEQGHDIGFHEVDAAVRLVSSAPPASAGSFLGETVSVRTERKLIVPRSANQAAYLEQMAGLELVFGLGPAGTGKTYLAVAQGVSMLKQRQVERLVLSRPAVEAGERLGFLPGDMKEKVDPYLQPLYDALYDMLPEGKLQNRIATGQIEIAPLAFMRGRTLANAFVILDEAQNSTVAQMKMFLTRLGEGSRMVVTGDPRQSDLPRGVGSGLVEATRRLSGVRGIGFTHFDRADIVRHPLVGAILEAFEDQPDPPDPEHDSTSSARTNGRRQLT